MLSGLGKHDQVIHHLAIGHQPLIHGQQIGFQLVVLRIALLNLLRRQINKVGMFGCFPVPTSEARLPFRQVWSETIIQDPNRHTHNLFGLFASELVNGDVLYEFPSDTEECVP